MEFLENLHYSVPDWLAVVALIVFALGWIAPFVIGLIRMTKEMSGIKLAFLGGAWGMVAFVGLVWTGVNLYEEYTYNSGPDSVLFDSARHVGDTGKIIMSSQGDTFVLLYPPDGPALRIPVRNGEGVVPTGIFAPREFEMVAPDLGDEKVKWTLSHDYWGNNHREICIRRGESVNLEYGLPIKAWVTAEHYPDGEVQFNLYLKGRDGRTYDLKASSPGCMPGFRILSKSGDVLWETDLKSEYGGLECLSKVPANVSGEVIIRPMMRGCPFPVEIEDTIWVRQG